MNKREESTLYVQCAECGDTDTVDNAGQPPVEWVCENGHQNTWGP